MMMMMMVFYLLTGLGDKNVHVQRVIQSIGIIIEKRFEARQVCAQWKNLRLTETSRP